MDTITESLQALRPGAVSERVPVTVPWGEVMVNDDSMVAAAPSVHSSWKRPAP
jgi:hypothetical protein